MSNRLQRVRGSAGIGLTWALGWAPIGALTGWLTALVMGFPVPVVTVNYAVTFAVLGFVAGAIFAVVLRLAEGRRRFDALSLPRFAARASQGRPLLAAGDAVAPPRMHAGPARQPLGRAR